MEWAEVLNGVGREISCHKTGFFFPNQMWNWLLRTFMWPAIRGNHREKSTEMYTHKKTSLAAWKWYIIDSALYTFIFHRIGEFTLILCTYFQTYFLKTAFPVTKGEHDRSNVNKENFPLLYLRSNNISVECYEMIFVCAYVHTVCNIEVLVPTPSDKIHNPHTTCSPANWNWWLWTSFFIKVGKEQLM